MKALLRLLLSAAAAVLLLALLAAWGDVEPREVWDTLRRLPPSTYALALALHAGIYVARALRYRALIPAATRPGLGATLAVSSAHNLAAYVLPAKTGEATLVLYLKGLCGVPAASGLAALLVARLLDLATLCAALAAATAYLGAGGHWRGPTWLLPAIVAAFGLAAAAFLVLSSRGERLLGPLEVALRLLRLDRGPLGARMLGASARLREGLRGSAGAGRVAPLVHSVVVWAGIFAFYAVLARGFGLPPEVGFWKAVFGSSLAVLTNLLPINAFAGFGTQETGWVLGFGLLGVERDLAFATGVGVHLVQLANVCLMGLAGHVAMGLLPRAGAAAKPPAA